LILLDADTDRDVEAGRCGKSDEDSFVPVISDILSAVSTIYLHLCHRHLASYKAGA